MRRNRSAFHMNSVSGRVRRGGDDEVGRRKQAVERVRRVNLRRTIVLRPRIDPHHVRSESHAQPHGLRPDAADPVDENGGPDDVDIAVPAGVRVPAAPALRFHPVRQPARERQHEHQDVMRDVVGKDAPRIRYHHRMLDEARVVVAGEGGRKWALEPAEVPRSRQRLRRHPSEGRIGTRDEAADRGIVLGDRDIDPGDVVPQPFGQGTHVFIVRRKDREQKLIGHDSNLSFRLFGSCAPGRHSRSPRQRLANREDSRRIGYPGARPRSRTGRPDRVESAEPPR